ncbi:hypothetical protein JZ751_018996 [Albula glossodonta]|uniref:LIM zinc-binding domain-containing protein n=1 Tax=Albula glossodonta TaxID=121402 RepID=A0A8T2NV70_9TELE|nr:hypothetical protein JZ751_018996 [Albula glossodonta]
MVNPGGSTQPPPVGAGSMSWKRCAGCGGKIADRFLLFAMDSYWHSRCLKCSCCQAQLGEIGTSCYTKSGMILCRNDYIRKSAVIEQTPGYSGIVELAVRACFTCSTCRNRLVPGDRFHYINGSLFCEHDRPTALINGHLNSLQTNPLMPDQKKFNTPGEILLQYCMLKREGFPEAGGVPSFSPSLIVPRDLSDRRRPRRPPHPCPKLPPPHPQPPPPPPTPPPGGRPVHTRMRRTL